MVIVGNCVTFNAQSSVYTQDREGYKCFGSKLGNCLLSGGHFAVLFAILDARSSPLITHLKGKEREREREREREKRKGGGEWEFKVAIFKSPLY